MDGYFGNNAVNQLVCLSSCPSPEILRDFVLFHDSDGPNGLGIRQKGSQFLICSWLLAHKRALMHLTFCCRLDC